MACKCEITELTKVFDQLQRFAEYTDLKKLHAIVIPEISKFEQKMMSQQGKLERFDLII